MRMYTCTCARTPHTDTHKARNAHARHPKHTACALALDVRSMRGNGEVIQREEFEQRKAASEQARQARLNKKPKKLASQGKAVEDFPVLQVNYHKPCHTPHVYVRVAWPLVGLVWAGARGSHPGWLALTASWLWVALWGGGAGEWD